MRISDFICTFIPMKEQVTDISKVLQGMTEGIRLLRGTVNQQYAEIIKLKNSCTFRSDFGADAFPELHSIVETAKKHDKTPYNAIQALFKV